MMRKSSPALVLAALATVAQAKTTTVTVTPIDGQAILQNNATTWTLESKTQYLVAQRASTFTRRGILEFDLSAIPAGWPVTTATLDYNVGLYSGSTSTPPQVQFSGYAGNGIIEAADAAQPLNVVGTGPAALALGPQSVALSPSFVQSITNGPNTTRWAGLYSDEIPAGPQTGIDSTLASPSDWPRLTVTYATPDVWVSGSDFNVRRYSTTTGTLAETLPVPYPAGQTRPPSDTFVRGTAVDRSGRLSVFNGATAPYVSTYDPAAGGTWTHRTDTGLSSSTSPSVPNGSVAALGSYLLASDMVVSGGSPPQTNGVVRFNTADESVARFGGDSGTFVGNAEYLTRGQDGLLYVLTNGFTAGRITVKVFNPYSGALLRTVPMPAVMNAIAVGPTGEIYATRTNGQVYDLSPTGTVVNTLSVASELEGIDLATDGSIVLGSRSNGVRMTDTSLSSSTTVLPYAGAFTAFVTFAAPAPERGWRRDSGFVGAAPPAWSDPANWTGAVPDSADGGADSIAVFGPAITANRTFRLDSPRTIGTLVFDSAFQYRINNGGSSTAVLTMDVPAGQRALIDVVRGSHTLATSVVLNDDLTVRTAAGATVAFPPTFGAIPGRLDVAGHNVIWDYAPGDPSPASAIRAGLYAGRGTTGAWNGPGIVSSAAAADPARLTAVGWAEAADLGLTTFAGQPVDASAIILELATYGDTNLDGRVDADDYARVDRAMALGLAGWINGDFNYDGSVTTADYLLMDQAYAHQSGGLSPDLLAAREAAFGPGYVADLMASVPEPGGIAIMAALVGLLPRRRRASGSRAPARGVQSPADR